MRKARKVTRSWPLQIALATIGSSALLLFSMGGCSDDQGPAPATAPAPEAPPPADPQGTINANPSTPPRTQNNCEELGTINGASLIAKLTPRVETQAVSETLANRPVPSRLGVVAVGTRAALQGNVVALGTGLNSNYATCTHCFAIALGCGTDCKPATWFYPKSGSAVFTAIATADGEKFEGKFTDVELEQVTIDWPTEQSTVVAKGACLHVTELKFSATASNLTPTPSDAGTPNDAAADADSSSSSSSTSSTSGGGGTSSGGCLFAGVVGCGGGKDF